MGQPRIEQHGEHTVHVLEDASGQSARVLTSFGFNCYSFRAKLSDRSYELLASADHFADQPSRPAGSGIPILFPFPNRIRGGRFNHGGKSYELERNERGVNAIHGLVLNRAWRVLEGATPAELTGQFQLSRDAANLAQRWPADFVLEMKYELAANRLTSRFTVRNPDSKPLPWGFGTHPYFRLPLDAVGREADCYVHAPVRAKWELEQLLPTGRRIPVSQPGLRGDRPLSELKLDDVFTDLEFEDDWCTCRLVDRAARAATVLRFDRVFRELVIFIPPARGSVCLEPYTCVTDAANLHTQGVDAGWRTLEPGESVSGTISIELVSYPS